MGVVRWAGEMVHGLGTVATGMEVTLRHLFKRPVTMHYPEEKWTLPPGYRGLLKVDMEACIVCDLCMKSCPVDCIIIEWKREAGKAGKIATRFEIDYQKCMYCGLCTPTCPTRAIWHTNEYENSSFMRDPLVIDWVLPENRVKNPDAKPKAKPKPKPPAAKPTAAAPAAKPAAAAPEAKPATEKKPEAKPPAAAPEAKPAAEKKPETKPIDLDGKTEPAERKPGHSTTRAKLALDKLAAAASGGKPAAEKKPEPPPPQADKPAGPPAEKDPEGNAG